MSIIISLVIPCFNEEERLEVTSGALKSVVSEHPPIQEIVFVNDGSSDKTEILLEGIAQSLRTLGLLVKLVSYQPNRGKGAAIREGIKESTQEWILLCDADFSCPLTELAKLLPHCTTSDVVFGSRKHPLSQVENPQPWYRTLLGRAYSRLSRVLLKVPAGDFTCGFKLLRRQAILPVAQHMRIDRWVYDSELLALAYHRGLHLQEVGVRWKDDDRTRVKLVRDIGESLWHLLLLAVRVRLQKGKRQ